MPPSSGISVRPKLVQRQAEAGSRTAEETPERGVHGDVIENDVDADGDHQQPDQRLAQAAWRSSGALELGAPREAPPGFGHAASVPPTSVRWPARTLDGVRFRCRS